MTTTYAQGAKNPTSRKVVFATVRFSKHFFGWVDNSDGTYYQASSENVSAVAENDIDLGAPEASQAALVGATAPAWFWDWTLKRLWIKPTAATTPWDNFVLATIDFRWGNFGGEDSTSLPFDPLITTVPTLTLRVGTVFDSTLGQTGSGSLGMVNSQNLFTRTDFEPDGQASISEAFETFGGV